MTHCEIILRHLEDYGSISSLTAITEYGILRLASRVTDLKRKGHRIKSTLVASKNRYGEKIHYSVYTIEKEN